MGTVDLNADSIEVCITVKCTMVKNESGRRMKQTVVNAIKKILLCSVEPADLWAECLYPVSHLCICVSQAGHWSTPEEVHISKKLTVAINGAFRCEICFRVLEKTTKTSKGIIQFAFVKTVTCTEASSSSKVDQRRQVHQERRRSV